MSSRLTRSALFQLVVTRWRVFYREPGVLFWSFGFPIVLAIALGIAFRSRPNEPSRVAVASGPEAAATIAALEARADLIAESMPEQAAQAALRSGRVDLVVEPGSPLVYRFDPSRPEGRLARSLADDAIQRARGRVDVAPSEDVSVTELGSRYIDFLIPGLLGVGLMSGGLWGVGYVIVEMRTRKLMKRFLATPMRRSEFLLAFVLARALFLLVEIPVLLGFATLAFDVPIRGSLALLVGIATLGSLAFAGLGLLVASRAENIQTASGLINLASMPMFIGSGTFFSWTRFPEVVQPALRALPLTLLNDALRGVMLDGRTAGEVVLEIVGLALWSVVTFGVALKVFRWR